MQKLTNAIGHDAAKEFLDKMRLLGGHVVHIGGDETISGHKTFSVSIGINGVHYDWPKANANGVLANDGDGHLAWRSLPGTGTVTSVGLHAPQEFYVTGSPVKGSGDLVLTKMRQFPNRVYAGPKSGDPAVPVFRPLVEDDIPVIPMDRVDGIGQTIESRASKASVEGAITAIAAVKTMLDAKADVSAVVAMKAETASMLANKVDRESLRLIADSLANDVRAHETAIESRLDRADEAGKVWGTSLAIDLEAKLSTKATSDGPTFTGVVKAGDVVMADGSSLSLGSDSGVRIGKTRGEKLAFYGAIPVNQPVGSVITALANLGLVKDPKVSQADIAGLVARLEAIEAKLGL